jgi:hypothetical protein
MVPPIHSILLAYVLICIPQGSDRFLPSVAHTFADVWSLSFQVARVALTFGIQSESGGYNNVNPRLAPHTPGPWSLSVPLLVFFLWCTPSPRTQHNKEDKWSECLRFLFHSVRGKESVLLCLWWTSLRSLPWLLAWLEPTTTGKLKFFFPFSGCFFPHHFFRIKSCPHGWHDMTWPGVLCRYEGLSMWVAGVVLAIMTNVNSVFLSKV